MTTSTPTSKETPASRPVSWDKPGPGTWTLDRSHVTTPGPIIRDLFTDGMDNGFAEACEMLGAPIAGMHLRWVNGRFYRRIVPLVGGDRDLPMPPKAVLWLATRLHPAFRRAEKRARETFEQHRWNDDCDRWAAEWSPQLVAENERFSGIDPAELGDEALARHLTDLHEHLRHATRLHFRLSVSSVGPMGLLMVRLREWGLDPLDTFAALVEASPATRSASDATREIATALREQGIDSATITSLDDVRTAGGRAAELLDHHLLGHGWRLTTGYDLEERTLNEVPELVVNAIRHADDLSVTDDERAARALAELRARVPAEHHEEFDGMVADARAAYGLRDENGPITYEWPAGLLRRALVEVGRRLLDAGRIASPDRVFELSMPEVVAMLGGATEPTSAAIDGRAAERSWWAGLDPPEQLGPDEVLPPLSVMPSHLARISDVVQTVMPAMEAAADRRPLHGLGVGTRSYAGTARVVRAGDADAFARVEPGDVVVAPFTSPTYNSVLAVAGAVVTDEGGPLCHAAVIARELDIPAVIGAHEATARLVDGAVVEVDPVAGVVRPT